MRQVDFRDKLTKAVFLENEELLILRAYHNKIIESLQSKYTKLLDKTDGSTKYDTQINDFWNTIQYHKESLRLIDQNYIRDNG
jgi:hypothetical protein